MHAWPLTYDTFNDETVTETFYFNITVSELARNLELRDRMEEIQRDIIDGPKREISSLEVRMILDLVKDVMQLSYGIRSADGRNHRKSPEIWDDFYSSAAYDKAITDMFDDTNLVFHFFTQIMPKKLRAEATEKFKEEQPALYAQVSDSTHTVSEETGSVEAVSTVKDDRPAYIRENRDPNANELRKMSTEELQEAFRRKTA